MGTRSLVNISQDGKTIATVYRQYDGYPECRGLQLFEFLDGVPVTNGIMGGEDRSFNGAEDLAAQWVCHEKLGEDGKPMKGNVYLYETGSQDVGEEFVYDVDIAQGDIDVYVHAYGDQVFSGNVESFGEFCKQEVNA